MRNNIIINPSASGGGGGTPAGSTGAIQFNDAGAFGADTSNLFWDDTNNRLGIGTASPTAALDIRAVPASGVPVLAARSTADTIQATVEFYSHTGNAIFTLKQHPSTSASGIITNVTQINGLDSIGLSSSSGVGSSSAISINSGNFVVGYNSASTYGYLATRLAAGLSFQVNSIERLAISTAGNVLVNGFTSSTVGLTVKGAASQTANLQEWQNSAGTVRAKVDAAGGLEAQEIHSNLSWINSGGNCYLQGTTTFRHGTTGVYSVTISGNTGAAVFTLQSASAVGQTIKGAASQTANLQEWQNSSATVLASVSSAGNITGANLSGTNTGDQDLSNVKKRTIGFSATGTPTTGQQGSYVVFPVAGTITGYKIVTNAGTCTVKTWKIASGTSAPTIANVISTSGVSLSSGTAIISSTTTDFTSTAVSANDIFAFDLTAVSGVTILLFELEITVS